METSHIESDKAFEIEKKYYKKKTKEIDTQIDIGSPELAIAKIMRLKLALDYAGYEE